MIIINQKRGLIHPQGVLGPQFLYEEGLIGIILMKREPGELLATARRRFTQTPRKDRVYVELSCLNTSWENEPLTRYFGVPEETAIHYVTDKSNTTMLR